MANDQSAQGKSPAPDNWDAQLRKGCLELAILASLWPEPLYGLGILRALRDRGRMEMAEGTLYPILNRLRIDGLVISEWRDAGTGHPRKYYTLTGAGRVKTVAMAGAWNAFSSQMDEMLSAVHEEGEANGNRD
jgi:PadR family transcriptional regulator PadR